MKKNSERGGAVLITTILILMISAVIAMSLLNSSRVGSRVSSNYKLQENAFNVAEAGIESVRSLISSHALNFNDIRKKYLFYNTSDATASDAKKLYDPNFNRYSEITSNSGVYGDYYGRCPSKFKGTIPITLPDGETLKGEWYVRIIDNDIVCNEPLSSSEEKGSCLNNDGYLIPDNINNPNTKGIMLNCEELDNCDPKECNFQKDVDHAVFIESRGIFRQKTRQGTKTVASRLVRVLVQGKDSGGGGVSNHPQKGGSASGTPYQAPGGTVPTGYVH